jgi:hypothetical protein
LISYVEYATAKEKPLVGDKGFRGLNGNKANSVFPPPFGEVVATQSRWATWLASFEAGLQLRDSAGLAPASPIVYLTSGFWYTCFNCTL